MASSLKIGKLGKKAVEASFAFVTRTPGHACAWGPLHPNCGPSLSTLQVYGAVAWSTDTASSGAGCLPGSGIVPQTLRAWSAAGAQGNWHFLPHPGALLWSQGTAQLTWQLSTSLVMLRKRTREPSGQGISFPAIEMVTPAFVRFFPCIPVGVLFLFSYHEMNLPFISGGDPKPWEGGLGPKNFLTSGQDLFLISFCCS